MSKVLTTNEVLAALKRHADNCDEEDLAVLSWDLGELLAKHCGGEVITASLDDGDGNGVCIHFGVDENVPADGGVYKYYDTDVTWKDGEET